MGAKLRRLYKVGLTGGIGSGKSFVAGLFELYNIPVYYADKEAKRLMYRDKALKDSIKRLLGSDSYHNNGRLNRAYISRKIFNDKSLLKKMNALVHPAVKADFSNWALKQRAPYVLEESAIIYENKLNPHFDKVILVTADKEVRIERVMQRDGLTAEQVESRMKNQFSDKKKVSLADFVIENNGPGKNGLIMQIDKVHKEIISLIRKKK